MTRKILGRLLAIFLLAGGCAWGQTQPPSAYPAQLITYQGAPFGVCDVYQVALNVSTGDFYSCNPTMRTWRLAVAGILSSNNTITGQDTFTQGIIAPSIGPSAAQQHTLPAVASDVFGLLAATQTFSGLKTFSQQITSTVSTGTAPFSIASTTQVTNLNAQLHGGLSAPASAIVGISDSQTLTNKTLTAPVMNGTPTGTGIPTLTALKGSAGSNYTTTSTFLVAVDSTNLKYVVTINTGWKLAIAASGSGTTNTAVANNFIGLLDGASTLAQVQLTPSGAGVFIPFSLNWVITGDGNSHTIQLAFATSNSSDAAAILNGSSPPVMTFILTPSN